MPKNLQLPNLDLNKYLYLLLTGSQILTVQDVRLLSPYSYIPKGRRAEIHPQYDVKTLHNFLELHAFNYPALSV